jgi:chorismate lyase
MSQWRPLDKTMRARVPAPLWSWLTETGSLTQRLKMHCRGVFDLVVLDERDEPLSEADAALVGLEPGAPARVREVQLCCDGVPCIYARSLLPYLTLHGAGGALDGLGKRPLGDALFAYPDMARGPIEVSEGAEWGRRSVFRLAGQPVLVAEYFLPGLAECAD